MGDKRPDYLKSGKRGLNSGNIFKTIQAELNTTQNKVLLGLGALAAVGVFGYVTYVRHKYERLGYYMALQENGQNEFIKKKSNWET